MKIIINSRFIDKILNFFKSKSKKLSYMNLLTTSPPTTRDKVILDENYYQNILLQKTNSFTESTTGAI